MIQTIWKADAGQNPHQRMPVRQAHRCCSSLAQEARVRSDGSWGTLEAVRDKARGDSGKYGDERGCQIQRCRYRRNLTHQRRGRAAIDDAGIEGVRTTERCAVRRKSAIMGKVLNRPPIIVRRSVTLRQMMAVGSRGRQYTGLFTQHAGSHRALDGEQYGKQYQEPDAKFFHGFGCYHGVCFRIEIMSNEAQAACGQRFSIFCELMLDLPIMERSTMSVQQRKMPCQTSKPPRPPTRLQTRMRIMATRPTPIMACIPIGRA